jgi:putative transcriptional regulator
MLDLFKIENNLEARKGLVLISEPLSFDDYFGRSVLLLTEHNKNGSVGFVLNKPTNYILSDLFPDVESNFKIFQGGPVEPNSLHYIHSIEQINQKMEVGKGLFWGGDFEQIKQLLKLGLIKENQIQFFVGYSGWEKQQLQEEIEKHYWIITHIDKEELFTNQTSHLWQEKVKKLGTKYKTWLNVPENPNLN